MMNGDYYVADEVYTYTIVVRRRYNLEYLQKYWYDFYFQIIVNNFNKTLTKL